MRVLTYNIAGDRARRCPFYLERIAELIRKTEADVVGLQEVVHHEGEEDLETVLARLTGLHASFLPAHRAPRGPLGNAVLSREPIRLARAHALPGRFPEPRVVVEAVTSHTGNSLTVFNTHLVHLSGAGAWIRRRQADELARHLSRCREPHLLLGDLNAGPRARELHPLRRLGARHDHLQGLKSWPARRPLAGYDHVWPGPGWEVEEVRALGPHLSDHRPVLANLRWHGGPPRTRSGP